MRKPVPFDLYRTNIPPEVIAQLPESVARENRVVPVRANDFELVVAMEDPDDRETLAKLRFFLNREVAAVFATREAIQFAIEKYYPAR
jgi:type IV pilus assembly protein PilB